MVLGSLNDFFIDSKGEEKNFIIIKVQLKEFIRDFHAIFEEKKRDQEEKLADDINDLTRHHNPRRENEKVFSLRKFRMS
jgi:hypothetical protein